MIKVSVIVPVYNAEEYIERSLLSLINQTLDDIEIIIIDDGSTDNSLSMIENTIKKNPKVNKKINLVSRNNKGVAATRSEGVFIAKGEYIIHLDSDDWADYDWLRIMYETACSNNSDIVICDYTEVYNNKQLHKTQECYSSNIKNIDSLLRGKISNANWNKLIKKDFLVKNNINFIENINMGEDFLFSLKALYYTNKVTYISRPLYYYNKMNQSSLTQNYSYKALLDITEVVKITECFLKEKNQLYDVEKSLNLFKLNIRLLYIISASNDPRYIKKAISLYPETNYLIKTKDSPKILNIIFSIHELKLGYINNLVCKLYLFYRELKSKVNR
ncbi:MULTISPECIES: glycosyltransferase family 2 protein [Providencia]|uniref:glycosyltransferase family 2 protein n=1 Tax=Providencia TaxID=586 RepID=UPI0015EC0BC1|nr:MULTISPECIES: glycosyltransferase family 2 protein [Providencia]ELR5139246.1 glycosyltransferase family 2 protein [Providencia rettgeri]ELR5169840.1 glycosyltransferase family 2 protein [Providencia rettgeri]QLQ93671.1 glycosyltransferase family 2 protein [Providencia rettgeri]WEB84289.1 glycosyltransferase family 2 protein [Providencia rettgeri]HCH7934575.1 glycosyltransferase family 2 protein [Providencia rettgeri]